MAVETGGGGVERRKQRGEAGEEQDGEANRNHDFVEVGRANADARGSQPVSEYGEKCAGKNRDAGDQEKQVVKQEAGFAGNHGIELIFTLQVIAILDIGNEANGECESEETHEPGADMR